METKRKQFMVVLQGSLKDWKDLSPEESQKILEKYYAWVNGLKEQNRFKGGDPLKDGHFKLTPKGKEVVVDGPFTESKETLTGYFLVEAEDEKEIIEISKGCPALGHGESVLIFELGH